MADPVQISFRVRDVDGDSATLITNLPNGTTAANALSEATEMSGVLDAVLDGYIDAANVILPVTLAGGIKTAIEVGTEPEVQRGALFTFDALTTKYAHSHYVPAFKFSLYSGKNVVLTDPLVIAFIDQFLAGGTLTLTYRDRYNNMLSSVTSAVKSNRKK